MSTSNEPSADGAPAPIDVGGVMSSQPKPDVGRIAPRFNAESLVDKVYDAVKMQFTHKITPMTVMTFIQTAMEAAEKIRGASGNQKKQVVLKVVERFIEEIDDEGTRASVQMALDMLGPSAIDFAVKAANGQVDFGHVVAEAKKCCSIFPCLK